MGHQKSHQKKTTAVTRSHPTKTSVKSPVHPVEELQGAIGNREMGRLMETNRQSHPSSPFPKLQGELPQLGGMMPVNQGTIQRQPLFRGLSEELRLDTAMALPATGAVIQPKLTLGTPGDMYEEEADRVAQQVVDEIHSSPFRESNMRSEGERKPDGGEAGRVQRQITVRAAGDAGGELSSEWEGELQRAKSGGQPLSPTLKEPMERSFGADFSGVRVHTGAQADRLARKIQAYAFTTGQDVFFRQGAYEPGSRGGQELIAHELTHVGQQQRVTRETRVFAKGKKAGHKEQLENDINSKQVTNIITTFRFPVPIALEYATQEGNGGVPNEQFITNTPGTNHHITSRLTLRRAAIRMARILWMMTQARVAINKDPSIALNVKQNITTKEGKMGRIMVEYGFNPNGTGNQGNAYYWLPGNIFYGVHQDYRVDDPHEQNEAKRPYFMPLGTWEATIAWGKKIATWGEHPDPATFTYKYLTSQIDELHETLELKRRLSNYVYWTHTGMGEDWWIENLRTREQWDTTWGERIRRYRLRRDGEELPRPI